MLEPVKVWIEEVERLDRERRQDENVKRLSRALYQGPLGSDFGPRTSIGWAKRGLAAMKEGT